jgi:hypothetical protein
VFELLAAALLALGIAVAEAPWVGEEPGTCEERAARRGVPALLLGVAELRCERRGAGEDILLWCGVIWGEEEAYKKELKIDGREGARRASLILLACYFGVGVKCFSPLYAWLEIHYTRVELGGSVRTCNSWGRIPIIPEIRF